MPKLWDSVSDSEFPRSASEFVLPVFRRVLVMTQNMIRRTNVCRVLLPALSVSYPNALRDLYFQHSAYQVIFGEIQERGVEKKKKKHEHNSIQSTCLKLKRLGSMPFSLKSPNVQFQVPSWVRFHFGPALDYLNLIHDLHTCTYMPRKGICSKA